MLTLYSLLKVRGNRSGFHSLLSHRDRQQSKVTTGTVVTRTGESEREQNITEIEGTLIALGDQTASTTLLPVTTTNTTATQQLQEWRESLVGVGAMVPVIVADR